MPDVVAFMFELDVVRRQRIGGFFYIAKGISEYIAIGIGNIIKLFVSPGTCARVPNIALEEIGAPFETELIRMMAKEHKSAEYLAINPKGKVPALLLDGEPLTENFAILSWLNKTYPDAELLPTAITEIDAMRQMADLSFFSGTMHPSVTRIARPAYFVTDTDAHNQVREAATTQSKTYWATIDDRLSMGPWWYGEQWSIVDAYLFWAWWRVGLSGFEGDAFPNIQTHATRIQKRPSVIRVMQSEASNMEQLKSEGLYDLPN